MKIKCSLVTLVALAMMALAITQQAWATQEVAVPTITLDKPSLDNGGEINVSGQAPAGAQVYVEVYSADKMVRANRFDSKKDPKTGKIPYMFYLTHELPAAYKIFVPKEMAPELEKARAEGSSWKYSEVLKKIGADAAYSAPAKIKIDRYQATIMASILGSRGTLLAAMDEKESKRESMKLTKGRFQKVDNLLAATVETTPDGAYTAKMKLRKGLAPGKYIVTVTAVTGRIKEGDKETVKKVKSETASFDNNISFPTVYLSTAGTSINLLWPFSLTLVIAIFGVLMGAGGGFILNPILVSIFPALPHTIVAGTVMPTVLFAQGSGIYNYSKIKFINWKLGIGIGCAM
ncbi:MAG: sulfite exporter TauE/SafE family protein, partial [Desulfobulbaceae bacterium]|nr:sulfite exporter TauE/SafE family protein [Desulfobulbaceae bacterium]